MYVGSGSDRFELVKGEGAVTIFGFGNNDTIRLGTGLTSKALSFKIQNGDTLLKAGDDLLATLKSVQLGKVTIDNSPTASFVSGVFTVGKTGQVSVDYLFDGGGYEGELAIFSLSGLNDKVGSAEFIKEATRRALSNSELGHIVISDRDQGARFQENLNAQSNLNSGIYDGVEPVFMHPGDKFGIMLVPKGTVQQVFNNDPNSKYVNPLFSLTTVKPQNRYNGQFADITGDGSVFGIEDLPAEGRSDRDYNDIVFQVQGAVGRVISLDELLINGALQTQQDWRNSDLGQALVEYTKPYASPNMPGIGETLSERVLEILNQAASNKPSKGQISSPGNGANVNQAIADWINTANNRLATLTTNGESAIKGLDNNISDSSAYLDQQFSDLQVALSNDGTYMSAWKDYLNKELSRLQTYTLAQVTDLRNEILGTGKYLYQWADYTAKEINKTADYLDKWTTYAQNEIGRITNLLIGQTDYIADNVGVNNSDYKNLVKERKAIINDASATNSQLTEDKNKAVNEAVDVFRAFDSYRLQTIEDASTQYTALNNEQSSVFTDALSRLTELESNINGVLTNAWNQYQELDRTRRQAIDDAWNQASFLNYAWTNLTEDTKAQIDAWSKIAANQKGWHNTTLAERKQNVGLPYYASQGDWKETLKNSIDSALAFYGASNVVTPTLVSLFVDISWELKDEDYKGAIAVALSNFNVEPKVANTFVNTTWALKDGNFKDVLDKGLSSAGFSNANQFVDIAWGVKDGNYQKALTVGLQSAGLSNLKIDQGKANAFVNSAFALRDGQVGQVADQLLAVAGGNAQQLATSSWVQALRNGNPNDDRAAFSQGLSTVGFQNANQWVDIAWDVKENHYLDALSTEFTLAGFQQGKDWINMAGALQRDHYFSALSTGSKVAGFEKGENLAKAALALRQGDPINAFYEGLSLVDGLSELVDTFKYLKDGNAKKAVPSMIIAAPKLLTLIS